MRARVQGRVLWRMGSEGGIVWAPERPSRRLDQVEGRLWPREVTTPAPVITTLFIVCIG